MTSPDTSLSRTLSRSHHNEGLLDPKLIHRFEKPACFANAKEIISTCHDCFSNPDNGVVTTLLEPEFEEKQGDLSSTDQKIVGEYIIPLLKQPLALSDTFASDRNARSEFKKKFKDGSAEYAAMDNQRVRTPIFSTLQTVLYFLSERREDIALSVTRQWRELIHMYNLPDVDDISFAEAYNNLSFNAKLNLTHAVSIVLFEVASKILGMK
jgi:hypothetical protein